MEGFGKTQEEALEDLKAAANEPFLPELEAHVSVHPTFGRMIHHPLVVGIVAAPGHLNQQYLFKLENMKGMSAGIGLLEYYERPYRLATALAWWEKGLVDKSEMPKILGFAWMDYEDIDTIRDPLIRKVVRAFRAVGFFSDREGVSAPTEDTVVYRGGSPSGIAWSTSIGIAEWFARRWNYHDGKNLVVYRATAKPSSVLAMLFGRNEEEVVVRPRMLRDVTIVKPEESP